MSSFVSHGMDPAEVQGTGKFLQSKAAEMEMLIRDINSRVSGSTWNGPDAEKFKNQWWPGHRRSLQGISKDLHGLGQSALNNAEEQLQASGGRSSSGGSAIGGGTSPGGGAAPGSSGGGWGGPISKDQAKSIADRYIRPGERRDYLLDPEFGVVTPDGDNWYQCTIWAKARWRQMAEERGISVPDWTGNGNAVASSINKLFNRPDSHDPTVGAIVSFSGGDNGHVAVVEEIRNVGGRTQFRVSEFNRGGHGWQNAHASEFKEDRWVDVGPGQTFAAFPG